MKEGGSGGDSRRGLGRRVPRQALDPRDQEREDHHPSKLANVRRELQVLRDTWAASPFAGVDVREDYAELMTLNRALWDIEDRIREQEGEARFDREFVELARSVYRTNDRRAAVKKRINLRLGSELVEEKSYRGPQSSEGGAS